MNCLKSLLALATIHTLSGTAMSAVFIDNFSTDTSGNYTLTNTFGSGGSFAISGGTLNVTNLANNTVNVFHKTAQLEAGEYVQVTVPVGTALDFYLTVSTTTRAPNTGTEDGIRWNFQSAANLRTRTYRDGAVTDKNFSPPGGWTSNLKLLIYRDTNTAYRVGYDVGSGPVIVESITISQTAAVNGMFVGVEGFSASSATRNFDNLMIVPEPSGAFLGGLACLSLVLRRRRPARTSGWEPGGRR